MTSKYKIGDIVYSFCLDESEPTAYRITSCVSGRYYAKKIKPNAKAHFDEITFTAKNSTVYKTLKGAEKALKKAKMNCVLCQIERIDNIRNNLKYEESHLLSIFKYIFEEEESPKKLSESKIIKEYLSSKNCASSEQKESITKLLEDVILVKEKEKNKT